MYLSQTNIQELRTQVEEQGGFQIALVPMQPETFLNVKIATDALYKKLKEAGFSVLVDDRNKKPKNKFEVIEFLKIQHRVVISSRSISAGVYEYKNLGTDYFEKVAESEMFDFLTARL
ncbi:MAG: His/Gly/Thr/Pro-type tRNA ligase C-terminal domain-containing protein [Cocleimonas sp.]|nr:His/Gly/Thr/Pro-type tRNA ligase C-terminal domain-containing protein [Cocleimonas sp.]